MLLSPNDAELFFKLHRALLRYVNQRVQLVPDVGEPDDFAKVPAETGLELRKAYLDDPDLLQSFVDENPHLSVEEIGIVLSWRHHVDGRFYAFRQLKNYMVFLSTTEPAIVYGVVALAEPFENLIGPRTPVMVNAVLMPFRGKIIYDGMLTRYNISFGGGIKRSLNNSYREAKQRFGIVTSLPAESSSAATTQGFTQPRTSTKTPAKTSTKTSTKTPTKTPAKRVRSATKSVKSVLDAILGMTDDFCREHLNGEYAVLCRKLAEQLSRKRPSPLLHGQAKTWASGIIRTIGSVNFLDDNSTQPHMQLTAIDKALGVGASTGQGKSTAIRKLLKIRPFDTDWTLPSHKDEKSLTASQSASIYQFRIRLNQTEPEIWRRIQVQDCTLDKLHEHIQAAMGWTNSHLHQFNIGGKCHGDPALLDEGFGDTDCVDSTRTKISDIVPRDGGRFRFQYEYDFGDNWDHEVLFEGCPPAERGAQFPRCVEGQRACPPEDVGGVYGFADFLQAVADPRHEQHDELLEWNGPFDPNAFNAVTATQMMRQGLPAWR